jgi:hypothetical protein
VFVFNAIWLKHFNLAAVPLKNSQIKGNVMKGGGEKLVVNPTNSTIPPLSLHPPPPMTRVKLSLLVFLAFCCVFNALHGLSILIF